MTGDSGAPQPDCLFCKIVAGDIPSDRVGDNDRAVAFRDINPQAPVHVLVVPKRHEADVGALAAASTEDLAAVFALVADVAASEGVADGYRLIFNTGAAAGQTIFHAHAHVVGGVTIPEGRLV